MARRYRKSGAGCGPLVILVLVGLVCAFIQKFWPIILIGIVGWIGYKIYAEFNKSSESVEPEDEETFNNGNVSVTISNAGKLTQSPNASNRITVSGAFSSQSNPKTSSVASMRIKDSFVQSGRSISVGPYTINHGMLYFQERARKGDNFYEVEPSTIIGELPIGQDFDLAGNKFSYWPSYAQIPPDSRNTYLKWLSEDAIDPNVAVGYVFIYFYGLERRLVLDCEDELIASRERDGLIAEVERLKSIYDEKSGSFRGYSTRLLQWVNTDKAIEKIKRGEVVPIEEALKDESLATLRISNEMKAKKSLDAENALLWFRNFHPGVGRKYIIRDYFDIVLKGFKPIFDKEYPLGLEITGRLVPLELDYHAASLRENKSRKLNGWPDPQKAFDLRSVLSVLKALNTLLDELAPHIRWFQTGEVSSDPLEIISKRPRFLWPTAVSTIADKIKNQIDSSIGPKDEYGVVAITNITEVLKFESAKKDKLSKKEQKMILGLVSNLNYFVDPDPDVFEVDFEPEDKLIITRKPLPKIKTTAEFKMAILTLKLCTSASWADGKVSPQEASFLENKILNTFKLSDEQKTRLLNYLRWLLAYDHHLGNAKRLVVKLTKNKKRELASLMIAIIAVDGSVSPAEVEFLEKTYKAFELDKDTLYSDLHSYQSDDSEVHSESSKTVVLSQEKIKRKLQESSAVSSILADVFNEEQESVEEKKADIKSKVEPHLEKLIKKLLSKDTWNREDFAMIAKEEGFLTNGAIESINEWAFEELGDALIEEDDESISVASALKSEALKHVNGE